MTTRRAPKPVITDKLRDSVVQHLASLDEVEATKWLHDTIEAAHTRVAYFPVNRHYLGDALKNVMQELRLVLADWVKPAEEKAAVEAEKARREAR